MPRQLARERAEGATRLEEELRALKEEKAALAASLSAAEQDKVAKVRAFSWIGKIMLDAKRVPVALPIYVIYRLPKSRLRAQNYWRQRQHSKRPLTSSYEKPISWPVI
jgi:hypothetical protein